MSKKPQLTSWRICLFWLPLCASWILMTAEGPVISATINRLPTPSSCWPRRESSSASSVFIESPIINLLSTATALVKDRQSYEMVRRFTVHWMILLTLLTGLIAYTPLFDVVVLNWMGTPLEVAQWVRPGMQIMLFWSAAIAWRRFLQGVLIQFGHGRRMAEGTAVRLFVSASIVIGLAFLTTLSGVHVATLGLMGGVIAEALYATWSVRPLFKKELASQTLSEVAEPLSYRELLFFHLPLANTSILILFVQPLVNATLARLDQPTESLAAWPVIFQAMLLIRAPALSLPEAVIALSKEPNSSRPLRRFSLGLTAIMLLLTALFVLTPLADFYIFSVQQMSEFVGGLVKSSLIYFILFPALWVITSWLRGVLIHHKATKAVNRGMILNLVITAVMLLVGLWVRAPGLTLAAVTLNVASFFEAIFLFWRATQFADFGLRFDFGLASSQATIKR